MEQFDEVVEYYEEEYDIVGLLMRDFGSCAWSLNSDSSDHDALLVYTQDPSKYQKVGDNSATEHFQREWQGDADIDVQGWSLQKFIGLVADSNPTVMELLNSPVTYYQYSKNIERLFNEFAKYCNDHVNPVALYWHYRSLGEDQYTKYVEENVHYDKTDESYKILDTGKSGGKEYWTIDVSDDDNWPHQDTLNRSKDRPNWTKTTTDQSVKRNLFAGRGFAYARYVRLNKGMPPMNFNEYLSLDADTTGLSETQYQLFGRLVDLKTAGNNEIVGNAIEDFAEEEELSIEPDNERLIADEQISDERCNEFVDACNLVCQDEW